MTKLADELEALAARCEALRCMSRGRINEELAAIVGDQFNYNYLGYIEAANRLAIPGFAWSAGVSVDSDDISQPWANVHSSNAPGTPIGIDISVQAANEAIALVSAWLKARAAIHAMENSDA